tara:strand:+ start:151 stop:372 length:222 start_codon:yes stop_codon:yes gene_type:complete
MRFVFSFLFRGIIMIYQKVISPLLPARCRYSPTCSEYAMQAIKKHGPWQGGKLTIKRVFNCHPWGGEGHDPVP